MSRHAYMRRPRGTCLTCTTAQILLPVVCMEGRSNHLDKQADKRASREPDRI
ncbi:hypothetical protein BKA81DRAFT_345605 [Phyllosticta paracitricarpa]